MSKTKEPQKYTGPIPSVGPIGNLYLALALAVSMTLLLAFLYASDYPMVSDASSKSALLKLSLVMLSLSLLSGTLIYMVKRKIIKPVKQETPDPEDE